MRFSKDDVLSVSGEFGVVNQIAFQGRSFAGASVADYHIVETGDIVYTKSPLKANPYGIIKTNSGVPGIVSTLYAVYHPKRTVFSQYVDYYFANDLRLNKYLKPLVNIGAKHDMKINNEFALTGSVTFPEVCEQRKITEFLSKLDSRIDEQRGYIEILKKYKRGLLSAIFERRLRFKAEDGSEFPEWGQKRLGDLMDFKNGVNASREAFQQGGIKCIGVTDVYAGNPIYSCNILGSVALSERQRAEYAVEYGDVLFQRSSETQEDIGHAAVYMDKYQPAVFNGFVIRGKKRDEYHPLYLHFELQTDFVRRQTIRLGAGAQHYNIGQESLATISVNMPSLPEQEKIASFLGIVDKKIGVEGAKIKTLQSIKRGLLQQLFI